MSDSISIIPSVPQNLPVPTISNIEQALLMMDGPLLIVVLAPPAAFEKVSPSILPAGASQMDVYQAKLRALAQDSPVVLTVRVREGAHAPSFVRQSADLILDITKSRSW